MKRLGAMERTLYAMPVWVFTASNAEFIAF